MSSESHEWRRIDNGANIGMTESYVWLRAASLQLHRILREHNGQNEIMDAHLFLLAIRQVLRGAEMSQRHVSTTEAAEMLSRSLAVFTGAVPGGKEARDIIEHFDEYTQGVGRLQQPTVKNSKNRAPDEQHAERFQIGFDWDRTDDGWRPILIAGPYRLDLIDTEDAALRLQCSIWEALKFDEGDPVPAGWLYSVQRPKLVAPVPLDER